MNKHKYKCLFKTVIFFNIIRILFYFLLLNYKDQPWITWKEKERNDGMNNCKLIFIIRSSYINIIFY